MVQLIVVLALVLTSFAAHATFHFKNVAVDVRGFADLGFVYTDQYDAWLDYGTSKARYGGDGGRELKPVFSEAQLLVDAQIGPRFKTHLSLKYSDEQAHPVDIFEAYLRYKSSPLSKPRWQFKFGTFLPPVSLENTAIGWTSPYTLTSSAINSWVGEELRVNGGEFRLKLKPKSFSLDLIAAGFFANDAAGSLMGYRGWAIHDHELGLFDHAPLPQFQLEIRNPRGFFRRQSHLFEPLHEIDGRPGAYVGVNVRSEQFGRFSVLVYDNNADPEAFNRTAGQYAWATRFVAVGYRQSFFRHYTFIAQSMVGETLMGPKLIRNKRVVDTSFVSAMGLLNRQIGNVNLALRGEYFETEDNDLIRRVYDNDEHGFAITATSQWRAHERIKLAVELQYIDHERPVREYAADPLSINEFAARFNARIFF